MNIEDLAERAAPMLSTLTLPSEGDNPPVPISVGGLFGPYELPEGLSEADREEMGIPAPDFPKLFAYALLHKMATELDISFIDAAELADLRAAAAANEGKRNAVKYFKDPSGKRLFRAMVRNFDTDEPIIAQESLDAIRNSA